MPGILRRLKVPVAACGLLAVSILIAKASSNLNTQETKLLKNIDSTPVVVELYTSQGCSSCPPADRLMNVLSEYDAIISLTLPIDYWDRLGWPDSFADKEHTARQTEYAYRFKKRMYTPQIVVNGAEHVAGNKRSEVLETIIKAQQNSKLTVPVSLTESDGSIQIKIDSANTKTKVDAQIILAPYFSEDRIVEIQKGENRGENIAYSHIVRGLTKLGPYDGKQASISIPAESIWVEGVDACAVLVQDKTTRTIIGAGKLPSTHATN